MANELSRTTSEVLKSVWRLTQDAPSARTVPLAEAIGASPATITATVKHLASAGLVEHVPYHGAVLTPRGRQAALVALRRHRIVECFLADLLRVDWTRVDALAVDLEHQMNDELTDRLDLALGEPACCPHGFAIPRGRPARVPASGRLAALAPGARVRVGIPGSVSSAVVDFLRSIDVVPGTVVEVVASEPLQGRVVVEVDGTPRDMSAAVAAEIRAEPIAEAQPVADAAPAVLASTA